MHFTEHLESRCLFTAVASVDPRTGTLMVVGDKLNDSITVTVAQKNDLAGALSPKVEAASSGRGRVSAASLSSIIDVAQQGGIVVFSGRSLIFDSATYRGAAINSIDINGLGGDDSIRLHVNGTTMPIRVAGGDDSDSLVVINSSAAALDISGGDGKDQIRAEFTGVLDRAVSKSSIDGGAGDDQLHVLGTSQTFAGAILGGDGNDFIQLAESAIGKSAVGLTASGGAGNDLILGSALADALFGDDGDDKILAGDGNDYVNGGAGNDALFGEAGNDTLDHGGGIDTLDGGTGTDIGHAGETDSVTSIEDLRASKE